MILQRSFQPMETRSREAHVLYGDRCIETIKNVCDPLCLLSLNTTLVAVKEKPLQSLVPEALDHKITVTLSVTLINYSDQPVSRNECSKTMHSARCVKEVAVMTHGKRPIIRISRTGVGRCLAKLRSDPLDAPFTASFSESLAGAVALHRFAAMIEQHYGRQVELQIDELFPL
jgi:hypothetical protein